MTVPVVCVMCVEGVRDWSVWVRVGVSRLRGAAEKPRPGLGPDDVNTLYRSLMSCLPELTA